MNSYFGAWYDGTELQPKGVDLAFVEGRSKVAMERWGQYDSGSANWTNLEEWHDANKWSPWDDADCLAEQDPAWNCSRVAANHVKTVRS